MDKLFIIKIGGQVLDEKKATQDFIRDFTSIQATRILVHGGGKIATRIGEKLGIESKFTEGRRITDEATRDLVAMVYGGLVNRGLVAQLQSGGCNAIGIAGADGNIFRARRRPVRDIDFGWVGDITAEDVNVAFLQQVLASGVTPVFAPLTAAGGEILNTNADTIASVLSVALASHYHVRLVYCFEKRGVLRNIEQEESVITHLDEKEYLSLRKKKRLADGILPKLENAFDAIHRGVHEVVIGQARDLLKNVGEQTAGTLITK